MLVLLANLAFNPWFARWRSLALMAGYDQVYERDSVPHDAGVRAEMPLAGTGLYPRMITFNADSAMSAWLGSDVRFTVDFTFADFEPWRGYSAIFDPDDPEVTRVAEFDQRGFALPALGLGFAESQFDVLSSDAASVSFAGRDWTSYQAAVLTNCPEHTPDGFLASYLQFGTPPAADQQYPACRMAAQIDVTYLPAEDLTIGLYVMTTSEQETAALRDQVSLRTEIIQH